MDGLVQLLGVKLDMIASVGSVVTLLILIIIYTKNYRTFKTRFSMAILLFITLFFVDELIYAISLLMNPGISTSLQTLINLIEFVCFLIILLVARD